MASVGWPCAGVGDPPMLTGATEIIGHARTSASSKSPTVWPIEGLDTRPVSLQSTHSSKFSHSDLHTPCRQSFSTTTRQEALRGARALRVVERRERPLRCRIDRGEPPLRRRAAWEERVHHQGQLLLRDALAEAAGSWQPEAQLTAACLQLSDRGLDGRTLVTHEGAAVQAAVAEEHGSGRQLGLQFLSRRAKNGRDKNFRRTPYPEPQLKPKPFGLDEA